MQTSGSCGLVWIFHEKLGEPACLLLVKFSEVWRISKFFYSFGRHLAVDFINYLVSEATLSLLQRSSKKLPLGGRKIIESTLINMMTLTLKPFLGHKEST